MNINESIKVIKNICKVGSKFPIKSDCSESCEMFHNCNEGQTPTHWKEPINAKQEVVEAIKEIRNYCIIRRSCDCDGYLCDLYANCSENIPSFWNEIEFL